MGRFLYLAWSLQYTNFMPTNQVKNKIKVLKIKADKYINKGDNNMKYYIENRYTLGIIQDAFKYRYYSDLKERLANQIKGCREYLNAYRKNELPDQSSWDCGRQDAYADAVQEMFRMLEVYKTAYSLSKGDMTRLKKLMDITVGVL